MIRSLYPVWLFLFALLLFSCHNAQSTQEKEPTAATDKGSEIPSNTIEEFPIFSGCEEVADQKACTDKRLLEYIYANLRLRSFGEQETPEGILLIKFTIEIDGSTSHPEIVKGQSTLEGSNIEAIILQMPRWTPGKKAGKPAQTRFNLPMNIRFE